MTTCTYCRLIEKYADESSVMTSTDVKELSLKPILLYTVFPRMLQDWLQYIKVVVIFCCLGEFIKNETKTQSG